MAGVKGTARTYGCVSVRACLKGPFLFLLGVFVEGKPT